MRPARPRPSISRHAVSRPAPAVLPAVGLLGAGDPDSSRVVYAMVIGLLLIGVALVFLGVWIVRQTRPDLEVLAPLERMGDGDWKQRDPSTQRRMLDELRPAGAQPLTTEPMPPPLDAEFEAVHPVSSFSDLGPGVANEQRDPPPQELDVVDPVASGTPDDGDVAHEGEALSDPRG